MSDLLVSSASFAYPEVPGSVRSEIATAIATADLSKMFVLSTCLRTEITVVGDREALRSAIARILGTTTLAEHAVIRHDRQAITHLYRVAAGLESPVIGEREILTQFRRALGDCKNGMDGLFVKLLEQAVPVARAARALLDHDPHESMATVAAELVSGISHVAILGSGSIARSVAVALRSTENPPTVTVAARRPERFVVAGVNVVEFSESPALLSHAPAVISATSAKTRLMLPRELSEILSNRMSPLTLIDMAMPPDFTPPADAPITYIDIDTLAKQVGDRVDGSAASRYVEDASVAVHDRVTAHGTVGPVIKHMMDRADALVDQTLERFSGRMSDSGDGEVLRQAVHSVTRALLADPVRYVKASDPVGVDAVAEAFGFDG